VLCPSFYRARIVTNPAWLDRIGGAMRAFLIGFFQKRAGRALARRAY
jgi:indolepyruvate ferredoxin oxidoreductase alpha subunit